MERVLQASSERRKNLTFPLPRDAMPDVRLTPEQVRAYRASAATVVNKTVEMERKFREGGADLAIAAGDWRLAKAKADIRVYRRTSQVHGEPEQEVQPMVLCVGTVRGTVEQTLYGYHSETTDEIRALNSVANKGAVDSAVVAVMERGTSRDPLRLLALKWSLNATPGRGLIKNRDLFTLESMGMQTDRHGEEFGYMLLKSVDHPGFPAFSTAAVRSRLMLCCIFRQLSDDSVAVYAKGIMDLGGDLSEWLCYNFALPRLADSLASTRGQRAKQLTAFAIKSARVFLPVNENVLGFTRTKMTSRATMRSASVQTSRTMSNSSDVRGTSPHQPRASRPRACLLCRKRGGAVPWLRASLQSCQLCDRMVCGKCLIKRELLAVPTNIQVWCCKGCIIMAKTLPIDPLVLCPLISY